MAVSTCQNCGSKLFELQLNEPIGTEYKYYFVQCAQCGVAIGTQEFFNVSMMMCQQNVALKKIAAAMNVQIDLPT